MARSSQVPSWARDRRFWTLVLGVAVVLVWLVLPNGSGDTGDTSGSRDPGAESSVSPTADGIPTVRLDSLPEEADDVVELIDDGGPFPYDKDGSTFGNYEGLLPDEPRGFYEEYTVTTPGSDDRGARRIIAARDGTLYWTADHYDSFSRILR